MTMEKKLTPKELLRNLILSSRDPFTSTERLEDIKRVLLTSDNFCGINHLYMVKTYLNPDSYPFSVSKDEAFNQCNKALNEGNTIAYFYLYLISEKEIEKRKYLNLSLLYKYPYAYLEYAKLHHTGTIYEKDLKKAYAYYKKAADNNIKEGYYGMITIDMETGNKEKQIQDYKDAEKKGFKLAGIIL